MPAVPSPDIFTRISDKSERYRLFLDLCNSRGEVIAKRPEPSADVLSFIAYDFDKDKLSLKLTGINGHLPPNGSLILSFFVGGEKYFFIGSYTSAIDSIFVETPSLLFHLQRREDYRLKIPIGFKALYEVVSVNGVTHKHSFPMADLSGGGCRILVNNQILVLKVGDELKGHVFLPDRTPIAIATSVRHQRPDSTLKNTTVCGLQFVGANEQTKNRIVAVVMDLYRQLFSTHYAN